MLRRSLLAGIGAVAAVPALGASPVSTGLKFESYFKGVNAAQRSACAVLQAGERVHFHLQPQRHFDPKSIAAVDDNGNVLGYLPGRSTRHLTALLEQNWTAEGIVGPESTGSRIPVAIDISPLA